MMSNDMLKHLLHRSGLSDTDKLLLILHFICPCPVSEVRKAGVAAGVTAAKKWNISAKLQRSNGKAINTAAGWELSQIGHNYLVENNILIENVILAKPASGKQADFLPIELFSKKQYIEKIVEQANKSYSNGSYDCAAVMWRKLFEILIVEAYEAAGDVSKIIQDNGDYKTLDGLIKAVEQDYQSTKPIIKVDKGTVETLNKVRKLGNKSNHGRKFHARKYVLDALSDEVNATAMDFLHLADLYPASAA